VSRGRATDGGAGFLDARLNAYDLVVLDLTLPTLDGLEVALCWPFCSSVRRKDVQNGPPKAYGSDLASTVPDHHQRQGLPGEPESPADASY